MGMKRRRRGDVTKAAPAMEKRARDSLESCLADERAAPYARDLAALDWRALERRVGQQLEDSFRFVFSFHRKELDEPLTGFVAECSSGNYAEGIGANEFYWGQGESDCRFENGPIRGGFHLDEPGVILARAYNELFSGDSEDLTRYTRVKESVWSHVARTTGRAMRAAITSEEFQKLPIASTFRVFVCEHDGWGCDLGTEDLAFEQTLR